MRSPGEMTGVAYSGHVLSFAADDERRPGTHCSTSSRTRGHWVFAGAGLAHGDRFGIYANGSQTVVGTETDVKRGQLAVRVRGRSPRSRTVTSLVATMGVFTRGGSVFTASTIDWDARPEPGRRVAGARSTRSPETSSTG